MLKRYCEGLYFNLPSENAPDFVLGKISIKADIFLEWLSAEQPNEKGYVNLDVLRSREGRPYCAVDDFKKSVQQPPTSQKPAVQEPEQPEPVIGDDGGVVPF